MIPENFLDVPAKDSPVFWAFIGIIGLFILLIVCRDLILWYFRLNEVYDRIDELAEKVNLLSKGSVVPVGGGVSGEVLPSVSTKSSKDVEIAVAIAVALHNSK